MARSPIQSKKQGNKKSIGVGGWRQNWVRRQGETKFEKGDRQYRSCFQKKGWGRGLGAVCQLWYKYHKI